MIDSNEKLKLFETPKDLIMFYHTSTRNVGLFTSISLAILSYSRFYRGKSKLYSSGLAFISMIFVLVSFLINFKMYNILIKYGELEEYKEINNWIIVNKIMFCIQTILIIFTLYTFIRLYFNLQF